MTWIYSVALIFVFLVGVSLGSFLNVVIYRLPRQQSVILPRSHCVSCLEPVPLCGLIPIFGFFLLRGKCFFCKEPISFRYPIVELLSGAVTVFLFLKFFSDIDIINFIYSYNINFKNILFFFTSLFLFYSGLVLSLIDYDYGILPDMITIPGIFIGLLSSSFHPRIGFLPALFASCVGFLGLWSVTIIYKCIRKREGMGFGDIKYLAFIGAFVGLRGVFFSLLIACLLGSVFGIFYGLVSGKGLSVSIPFGPFLAISAFFVYLSLC